jgi:hypothetical protein
VRPWTSLAPTSRRQQDWTRSWPTWALDQIVAGSVQCDVMVGGLVVDFKNRVRHIGWQFSLWVASPAKLHFGSFWGVVLLVLEVGLQRTTRLLYVSGVYFLGRTCCVPQHSWWQWLLQLYYLSRRLYIDRSYRLMHYTNSTSTIYHQKQNLFVWIPLVLDGFPHAKLIVVWELLRSKSVQDAILTEVKPHLESMRSTRKSLQNAVDTAKARFWLLTMFCFRCIGIYKRNLFSRKNHHPSSGPSKNLT